MTRIIRPGETNIEITIRIVDSVTGLPETGVVAATAGLSLWYRRQAGLQVAISPSDLSALDDAHSDGGMLHIGDGYYRLDSPDLAFATGTDHVIFGGTATNMLIIGTQVEVDSGSSATAQEFTYTVTDSISGDPIYGVSVWITTDQEGQNTIWAGSTDGFGVARDTQNTKPWLQAGTYFFFRSKAGYSFTNPDTEVV